MEFLTPHGPEQIDYWSVSLGQDAIGTPETVKETRLELQRKRPKQYHLPPKTNTSLCCSLPSRGISRAKAPDPELDELKERAKRLGQRVDWDKEPKAPKRPRATGTVSTTMLLFPPAEEGFAAKLTQAVNAVVARRPGSRKVADNRAEAQRSRYLGRGGLHPRERTKGA